MSFNHRFIKVHVTSQVDAMVGPANAEACDYPAAMAAECQDLSDRIQLPVVLSGARQDRHTFYPQHVDIHAFYYSRKVPRRR
jgi:hypothetical protein